MPTIIFPLFFSFMLSISSVSECSEPSLKVGYEVINQFINTVKNNENAGEFKLSLTLLKYEDAFTYTPDFTDSEFFDLILIPSPTIDIDTLLAEGDFACMKEQIRTHRGPKRLNRKSLQLRSEHLLKKDQLPERKRLFPGFTKYNIAWPLFSQDKKVAFLYVEQFCGIECGSGELYIYEVGPDRSWQKISSILLYIS